MNRILKFILVLACICNLSNTAIAQFDKLTIGLHGVASIPVSKYYKAAAELNPGREGSNANLGFEAEINAFYKIRNKTHVFLGLGYISYRYSSKETMMRFSSQTDLSNYNGPISYWHNTSLNYLNIPFGFEYKLSNKWYIGAGIQNMFLINAYDFLVKNYGNKTESIKENKTNQNQYYSKFCNNVFVNFNYSFFVKKFPLIAKLQIEKAIGSYFHEDIPATFNPTNISLGFAAVFNKK